jgi:hypothetical protein
VLYCFAAGYAHRSKYNLAAVGLSGVNKVKIIEKEDVVGEIKFQGTPLCLQYYRYNDNDFLFVSGVEGTIYSIKVKILKNK